MAGTLISSLAQTTLNPQRYVDETLKRMTPQMTMAFSPEGDDLVAMLDSSDVEGGFEAALKGFGVTASEYFSEGLGFAGARAMKAVGSKMLQNEFLKRAYVGWYMSKFNFDTPTAFKKIAEMGGWNGFLMEFGEELANIPLTNLITGDAKVMEGIIKDGELDTENLADIARTLLPISLAGGAVSLSSLAISKIAPEGVTITYRDINNLPATETINKGVWDAVTEVMKSPAKVRAFIANELPKLKVEGKGRQIVTSMLERAAIEFDRGVVGAGTRQIAEATSPLEVTFEPIDDSEKAPKVEIIAKRRQKLNRDRTKLVPTGGFDYFAKVGDKEVKLSDAEYKAYKESGVLPESVSAVEVTPEVEGEAVTPEAVAPEVPALRDVESTAKALEGVKNIKDVFSKVKTFAIKGLKDFFHASPQKRIGRLRKGLAQQFGVGVYFSTSKDLVTNEFGENVTNVSLVLSNPVFTNTPEWIEVKKRAIKMADDAYGKEKGLTLEEDESYFRYDPEDTSEIDEIPANFISEAANEMGYDAIVDEGSTTYENEISVLDDSKIVYEEDIPSYLSEAYHKAKEDGSNPELVSAVEELLGKPTQAPEVAEGQPTQTPEVAEGQPAEVVTPEVAEVLSTEDTTRIALESLEVLPEGIESAEEGARIYHEAIGKEERTEAEDAVVMAVEDAVIGGAVVTEETPIDYEVASSNVEETTKALGTKSAEKLNSVKEKISQAETRKFEDDERKQATTRTDRGVQEVQPTGERDLGGREVSQPDRILNSVSTGKEWERGEQYNGDGKVPSSNGKPVIPVLYHGHKAPFDSFSREYRGTGFGNQGGGVFFAVRPAWTLGAARKSASGGYGTNQESQNTTPFVSKVKIKGNNFVFLDKPIPNDIVAQIGVINGIDPSKYNTYSAFLHDLVMSFVTDKKNFSDHSEAQTKAADELYKKGITGHASADVKDYEVVVYDESEIEITTQTRIYNSNAELISDQYHKAKADGSNPELVKAVDELLGKPTEAPKAAEAVTPEEVSTEGVTPEVPGVVEAAEGQPSAEGLTSKEKAEQANKRSEEIAKEIRKNLGGRGGITGITPFSRAKRLAEVDRATLKLIKDYIYQKVLAGAYTFKDFVKDMKENSKRLFGVQIKVFSEDERIFDAGKALFEIDDTFAQEIMKLKDDFISSINNNPSSAGLNFDKFVAANQALVSGFIQAAESQYGLNNTQATSLVRSMYYDAISSVAGTKQSFETIQDIKDFHKKINDAEILNDALDVVRTEDIRRKLNFLSRTWNAFVDAFVSPTRTFDDVFRNVKDRLSLEREVYASRKSRMGSSTKAGNWYNEIHKKIYGGLSWSEIRELNKFLVYRRIREVKQLRDVRVIEYNKLEKDLLVPGITDEDKAKIEKRMAELKELGLKRVMSGSVIVNGKRVNFEDHAADYATGIELSDSASATKIKERAKLYTDANNELLKMRLDAGLISQEAYDSMFDKDYVRRVFLDLSASTLDAVSFPSISGQIRAIKSGSEEKFLLMDTQSLLQLSAAVTFSSVDKNKFMQKVAAWTENNQPVFLDKVLDSYKKAFEKKNGRQPTQDEIDKFTKEQTLFMLRRKNQAKPVGFELNTYYVNGKEKILAVRNDLQGVFDTPTGREGVKGRMKGFIDFMSGINLTGLIKSSAVFYNPAFALKNFGLDLIHASSITTDLYKSFSANIVTILAKATGYTAENVYSKAINGFNSLFARSGRRDSRFDRLVKDYFAHGGGMSSMSAPSTRMYTNSLMSDKLERAKSELVKGTRKFFNALNSFQAGSELITRIIVYEAALNNNIKEYKKKNGIEPTGNDLTSLKESAAASAADLIDFREGTTITKSFDATAFPFLNAIVQGARVSNEFIRKNPGTAMLRLTEFGGMALGVALYNANSGDEDEKEGIVGYNGISDYMKSNYLVIMMPWTKSNEKGEIVRPYVSLKLTAELKATNIMINGAVSKQGAKGAAGQFAEAIKGGYVPEIGAASPTAQAAFSLAANKDIFKKGAPIYRSREEVLLPDRFNVGETKKIYRDLFKAFYDFGNEDGEDKGILGFDEAGPAQWQGAFEKAISPNNPYYLFLTSTYATVSELAGEKNEREVKALFDEQMSSLNSLTMGLYREPQSSIQQKNIKNKEELEFLEKQIGSWQKKNDDAIEFAAKTIRDFKQLEPSKRRFMIDKFFDRDVFNYISDEQMIKGIKAQGIKDIPENIDDIQDFIKDEESRLSLRLLEEFKPNFVFKHPALKSYAQGKDSYLGLNAEMINKIAKEYDGARDGINYLIALKFVSGDDFDSIVEQIRPNGKELLTVENITNSAEAYKYKKVYYRDSNRSSKEVSSESALNNLMLLKYLLENE